ncbi:hypothetical protein GCM10023238_39970 [Streptomyces heliomycini]
MDHPGQFPGRLVIWLAASAGSPSTSRTSARINKTYGTMAGVIVFLIWLWISNLAILLGLEFDAEIAGSGPSRGPSPRRAVHAAARHPGLGRAGRRRMDET